MNEYRDRVLRYRLANGVTQIEFAKLCGLSVPTIIMIEKRDRYYPNVQTRGKLERVLQSFEKRKERENV